MTEEKYYCKVLIQEGQTKGTECLRECNETRYCEHHKKYRIASDSTKVLCRKFKSGCTNEIPSELLEKGIKTCLYHYKMQTKTDGELCEYEGCKNPKKHKKDFV